MLDLLVEAERRLPELLRSMDGWLSRDVTYEAPRVERLFRQDGPNRIYLHRIHRTATAPFYHRHPWPSAMRVYDGWYEMIVGTDHGEAPACATLVLPPGAAYEMTDPLAKHAVNPLTPVTHSLMVTGPPWPGAAGTMVVANPPLAADAAEALLAHFRYLVTGSSV